MDRNIGWLTNVIILAFGVLFLVEAIDIPAGASDAIGPRLVPLSVAIGTIVLTLVLVVIDWRSSETSTNSHDITVRSLFLQAGPLLALVALAGQMIVWFGYLLATVIGGVIVFRLFANSWRLSIANGLAGAIVFYLIFIKLMGIYDPPGSAIDISNYLIW